MPALLTAKELREKRANLARQAQEILDTAREEDRDLTPEEDERFRKFHDEIETLGERAREIERHEELMSELGSSDGPRTVPDQEGGEAPESRTRDLETRRIAAFRAWALAGDDPERLEEHRDTIREIGADRKNFPFQLFTGEERRRFLERRAQSLTDAEGGHTVPTGFREILEEAMLQFGGMRQSRATILRTASGNKLEMPTTDDTSNSGALLAENTQDSEQDITFGQAELDAYKYTSRIIRVSKELLQDSAFDLASFLARKLGERLGRIHNTHFTTGTGSSQPQGVVTGSAAGPTGAGGQLTTFIYDDFVDLEHSVDPAYRAQAEFMFSDAGLQAAKKIKDDNGNPIWVPGLANRAPDRILNYPYVVNQDVADPAAEAKSMLFGDFSKFLIRDVLDITLVRMDERYADFHQVAWVAISRNDSVLIDAGTNPIKHFVHAAA